MQEEVDCEQQPSQHVCVADDEKAKACGHGHSFLWPHEIIERRNKEGESSPREPGEIEEAFDHITFTVIARRVFFPTKQSPALC